VTGKNVILPTFSEREGEGEESEVTAAEGRPADERQKPPKSLPPLGCRCIIIIVSSRSPTHPSQVRDPQLNPTQLRWFRPYPHFCKHRVRVLFAAAMVEPPASLALSFECAKGIQFHTFEG